MRYVCVCAGKKNLDPLLEVGVLDEGNVRREHHQVSAVSIFCVCVCVCVCVSVVCGRDWVYDRVCRQRCVVCVSERDRE